MNIFGFASTGVTAIKSAWPSRMVSTRPVLILCAGAHIADYGRPFVILAESAAAHISRSSAYS